VPRGEDGGATQWPSRELQNDQELLPWLWLSWSCVLANLMLKDEIEIIFICIKMLNPQQKKNNLLSGTYPFTVHNSIHLTVWPIDPLVQCACTVFNRPRPNCTVNMYNVARGWKPNSSWDWAKFNWVNTISSPHVKVCKWGLQERASWVIFVTRENECRPLTKEDENSNKYWLAH
jgi:hypothetical protein